MLRHAISTTSVLPHSQRICGLQRNLLPAALPSPGVLLHVSGRSLWTSGAGVYTHTYSSALNIKNAFPVFGTMVEANHVQKEADAYAANGRGQCFSKAVHQHSNHSSGPEPAQQPVLGRFGWCVFGCVQSASGVALRWEGSLRHTRPAKGCPSVAHGIPR